ncbi:MAG: hypothetical protein LQ348_006370, partial [Seirophora lacunosa]
MIGGFAEVVLRRKRGPSDIELASTRTHEHHSQGHPPMNLQDRLSKALFDNDPKPAIWSPLVTKPLTIFTESKLLEMEPTFLRPVLEYLHISTEGSRAESVIVLVEAVARLLKENGDRNLSIHSLLRKLYEAFNGAKPPFNVAPELCQGIFALFGVLTMLYKAGYPMKSELLYPSEPDVERMSGAKRRTAVAGRPIGSIIRAFGEFTPYIEKYPTDGDEAEEKDTGWKTDPPDAVDLYVSTLNAYVLVKIGKVKIKWSDYLGAHLSFDMYSRTLTLFRFASFCGLNYPLAEESSFFD